MLNNLTIMGRLTAKPELNITDEGVSYCNFSIAVERPKKDDGTNDVDFFNCSVWARLAEIVCEYYDKGDMITLLGSLRTRTYTADDKKQRTVFIKVKEVHFSGFPNRNQLPETLPPLPKIEKFTEEELAEFNAVFEGGDYPF